MARVLCMTEFLDKDPAKPPASRSRSRSPSSGPRRQHRDHVPSSSSSAAAAAAASRSHSKERRSRPGGESPISAARNQFCTASETGYNRVQQQLSTSSGGVPARLAPRDDNADNSPVFCAGGFGHPAIESDIRDPVTLGDLEIVFKVAPGQIRSQRERYS